MKTFKLFTVLAMASMFVACVKDLMPVENENFQQGMEVVGGEVIGTDVTMDIPFASVQTKYAGGDKGWDSADKIGLGWLAQGGDLADDNKLYANHMFYVNNDNKFEARGNIYKGWHFAYYPYTYMETVSTLELDLNPAQELNLLNADGTINEQNYYKRLAQRFSVSALQYLTKESLVEPDYNQLKDDVDFTPYVSVARVMFRTKPAEGSAFAEAENMKNYEIKSIMLHTGGPNRFATAATLNPTKLHKYDAKETKAKNAENLTKSFKDAFTQEYTNSISIDVTNAKYKVGAESFAVAYILPYYGEGKLTNANRENCRIEVRTNKGNFTIKYVKNAKEGTVQFENNKAIQAYIDGLNADGELTKCDGQITLKLVLHEDDFGLNWEVANAEDWANKVQLATDLKVANPEFVLVDGKIDINEVTIPDGGVKLSGNGELNVTDDWTWTDKVELAEGADIKVIVAAEKTLTVAGNLAPKSLVNNGIIDAQAKAVLANLTNKGEVKVAYGAQVYPVDANSCGIISFVVPENYSRSMIENVTKVGFEPKTGAEARNFANVNTLIINGFEVDLHSKTTTPGTEGVDDPYLSTPGTEGSTNFNKPFGEELNTINFVLNNASIKSTESVTSVKNVTMTNSKVANLAIAALAIEGAENTVNATTISNGVTIKDGKNVVKAETITGGVIVKAGEGAISAKTINGDVTINGNYTVVVESLITGAISAKGDKIAVKAHEITGAVNVDTDECTVEATVLYGGFTTEKGFNVVKVKEGIFNGVNVKAGKGQISAKTIEGGVTISKGNYTVVAEKVAGNIDVTGENYLSEVAVVTGNVTINNTANTGCVLNGNKITGNLTLTGNGFGLDNVTVADVTLKEGNVKVNNTTVKNFNIEKGNASLTDCTITETLTNSGTVVINGETTMKNIVNNGSFTSYVDLHVIDVTLNEGSTTVLSSNGTKWDRTIWYTGKYVFDQMTLKGTVVQVNAAQLTADINAAIAAAANGTPQTVTLKGDVTLDEALTFTAPVTRAAAGEINVEINLNGYTIENKTAANTTKLGNVADECIVFYVDGEGMNLTIDATNGGKVIATGDDKSDYNVAVWAANGAKVTIKGGEYYNTPDTKGDGCDLIYARDGANIFVEGGTFKAGAIRSNLGGGTYAVLNCKDASDALITVSGGNFYQYGAAEAARVGSGEVILKEGYIWTTEATDGYYSVVAK